MSEMKIDYPCVFSVEVWIPVPGGVAKVTSQKMGTIPTKEDVLQSIANAEQIADGKIPENGNAFLMLFTEETFGQAFALIEKFKYCFDRSELPKPSETEQPGEEG